MRIEFAEHIIKVIKSRWKAGGYSDYPNGRPTLTDRQWWDLQKALEADEITNDDYEGVTSRLTGAIESKLIEFGHNKFLAMREAWKWSD